MQDVDRHAIVCNEGEQKDIIKACCRLHKVGLKNQEKCYCGPALNKNPEAPKLLKKENKCECKKDKNDGKKDEKDDDGKMKTIILDFMVKKTQDLSVDKIKFIPKQN